MLEGLAELLRVPAILAAVIGVGSILAAYVVSFIFARALLKLVQKTQTDVDDKVVEFVRRPIIYTVILVGVALAIAVLAKPRTAGWFLPEGGKVVVNNVLETIAVIIWTVTAIRVAKVLLSALARSGGDTGLVQTRTQPAIEIMAKVVVIGLGIYLVLVAWKVNVTGWLASAGIAGIVIGLAAKDTLANLFAGIFIIADAPYKIGDYIQLDGDLRGKVTQIGIRSTRILTREDIEITIPNAVIGNSKIVNEGGGPHPKSRIPVVVYVAYGADIDKAREVLLECAKDVEDVCEDPAPRVRFRHFGGSGLKFELLVWITRSEVRGRVKDALNSKVYKAFAAAEIEIPFSKTDVYIKEMPR